MRAFFNNRRFLDPKIKRQRRRQMSHAVRARVAVRPGSSAPAHPVFPFAGGAPQAKARLEEEYSHNTHPAAAKLVELAKELNETKTRLCTWFSNRRTKQRKMRLRAEAAATKHEAVAAAAAAQGRYSKEANVDGDERSPLAQRASLAFTPGNPQEQQPDPDLDGALMDMVRSPIRLSHRA